jgi:hypothetical protein
MRWPRRLAVAVLAVLAIAATASAASRGPAATRANGWHTLLNANIQGVFPLGAAAGRVWFVTESPSGAVAIWSAHVGAGGLTSPVSTSMGTNEWIPDSFLLGTSIVNCCVTATGSSIAPLLPSGKVGAWQQPLPGNPEQTTHDGIPVPTGTGKWLTHAAATVSGRTIWEVTGSTCTAAHPCGINGGGLSLLALCCTAAGQPVNLTSMLTNQTKAGATDSVMGTDTHGRLWFAWLDGASSKPGISFKLLQVDPQTLKPLATKVVDHVLLASYTGGASFDLACADSCRLVYQGLLGAFSWDGGAPTRLWANNLRKDQGGHLLAAAAIGGGLDVANYSDRVSNAPDSGQQIAVERGTSRGTSLHKVSSATIPLSFPGPPTRPFELQGVPTAMFAPSGLVVLGLYMSTSGATRLVDTVLHG